MPLSPAQTQRAYRQRKKSVTKPLPVTQNPKNEEITAKNDTVTHLKPLPNSNPDLEIQRQVEEIFPELKEVEPDFSQCQPEKPLFPAWCGCEYCKIQAYGAIRIHTENHFLKLEIERLKEELNKKR